MSDDPERLLDASGADSLERDLLGSVRHVGPPAGAKERAWLGIAGQVAGVTAAAAVTSSAAAGVSKASVGTFGSWALSTKLALVAAGGLALGGGYFALHSPNPAPPRKASVTAQPIRVEAPPAWSAAPSGPVAPAMPSVRVLVEDAPNRKIEPRRLDLLQAESALLTEARAQLRSGKPAAAQAALDRLQAQFPNGMLSQEREVLGIEVLYARGNIEGAKRRARAFVKAYPHSPHSQKLTRFLD